MSKKLAVITIFLALSQIANAEHGIRILDAYYGRSGYSCDATRALLHQCDGHGQCQVVASNRLCGDPARGKVKELIINYSCGRGNASVQATEGEVAYIDCQRSRSNNSRSGNHRGGIYVTEAIYSAGKKFCDATRYFQRGCDGQQSCSLQVSNQMCGDPFSGKKKRLEILYQCGNQQHEAVFWEKQRAILNCN